MNKRRLPDDWIVVKSKSHPDRVYYFNVKTNRSSWTQPTATTSEVAKSKQRSKKRKKLDDEDVAQSEPVTPEHTAPSDETSQRKRLVARRTVQREKQAESGLVETPQMKAIREKIQKRKEKASRKNTVPVVSITEETDTSSTKSLRKDRLSVSIPKIDLDSTQVTTTFTPQMQVIFERMQKRASKGTQKKGRVSDVGASKGTSAKIKGKVEEQVKARSLRHSVAVGNRRSVSAESPSPSKSASPEKDTSQKATGRRKSADLSAVEPAAPKRLRRSSLRKNIAAERMDNLRNSIELQKDELEESVSERKRSLSANESPVPKKTVPPIYKNAQVRLVRLKDKLLKEKLPPSKALNDRPSENSQDEGVTTVIDLVNEAVEDPFYEEMDWEPMEDEEITNEVQTVRTQLCARSDTPVKSNVPARALEQALSPMQRENRKLYIVVDTNVLLSNIQAVDLARETDFKTFDRPTIVIPWTVIRELDYIKDDKRNRRSAALCAKARRAVQYLNKLFSSRNPRVMGQTPDDAAKNKEKFASDCPDDEILQACLQIRDLGKSVALLTYDKNLCNKAMIHDIVTLGRNDPFEKIDYLNASSNGRGLISAMNRDNKDESMSMIEEEMRVTNKIVDEAATVIKDFLSVILSKEMHELYGDSWKKYVIIQPPWSTVCVLKCAVKHWIAATSESFVRKAEATLKDLLQIFNNSNGLKTLRDVGYLLEKCSDLVQMVNTDKHMDLMLRASNKIEELKKTFVQFEGQLNEKRIRDLIGVESNVREQQHRADRAFKYFEVAYAYARDMCGLAAEAVGMPCSIPHEIPNPVPPVEYVKQIQPELAANVNKLLHTLSAVLEQANGLSIEPRSLISLCEILDNFVPETVGLAGELTPLDIHCCVKLKDEMLKAGIRQLQELSTHFCRLASYRCT